ncbi:hypothetical protein BpHYR1_010807 [Brachionus plicatilis]|uniref:Uncharacterized protein n=1 Tax=Brachionus plicatilis TaxID=10195 RepID=A0A3M7Q3P9_BRAPC|nr:hypothetical protein BpHYR1_010807 [Brachionus plicatilis]
MLKTSAEFGNFKNFLGLLLLHKLKRLAEYFHFEKHSNHIYQMDLEGTQHPFENCNLNFHLWLHLPIFYGFSSFIEFAKKKTFSAFKSFSKKELISHTKIIFVLKISFY